MIKNLVIDLADRLSAFCMRRAELWLRRSRWWANFAESVETGVTIEEIRKDREEDQ